MEIKDLVIDDSERGIFRYHRYALTSPQILKLRRAEQHLDALKQAIQGFLESNPYTFILEPEPKTPYYLLRAKVNNAPPIEWSVIIGDFAHNARSALDLLVYQLSSLPLDDDGRFRLQFPIFDRAKREGKHRGYADFKDSYLAGVSTEHRTIIEGFQPYKRTDGFQNDALGILAHINDSDKHRMIHIVGAIGSFYGLAFSDGTTTSSHAPRNPVHGGSVDFANGFSFTFVGDGIIAEDGAVVAKVNLRQSSQVNMQPDVQVAIKFGEGSFRVEGRPVVDTLTFIHDRVKEVVGQFESTFLK